MSIYPAATFTDLPTCFKRCLACLCALLGRWWFAHVAKRPPRSQQAALASWLQETGPHDSGWKSSKEIAEQETQKMRSLTTRNLQDLVDHHRGETTDKIPTPAMQERAARLHQQHRQRFITAPIPRIPTKALLDAYNKEVHNGLPRDQRTTAALKRISSPLSLQETQRHPVVLSPMRKRAMRKDMSTGNSNEQHATSPQHTIAPAWPRHRTLHSIRLRKPDES